MLKSNETYDQINGTDEHISGTHEHSGGVQEHDGGAHDHVGRTPDHGEGSDPSLFDPSLYASVDNLAGTVAANGKPIWTAEQAATYLFRAGAGYGVGANMVMPTSGTTAQLNYGFHVDQASLANNGYVYELGGSYYGLSEYFNFAAFTDAQKAATREGMTYWDDVVSTTFVETHVDDADIAFGNYTNRPGTQAYARLLANTVSSNAYVNEQIRDIGGDVWVARNTASNFHLDEGGYGMNTLVHEIGHGFGMLHPGDYNFVAGGPQLSYKTHAEYYQDTRSYSILSYWNPRDIGARDYDFTVMNIAYGATPMVHDILSMQLKYGADMTTRTGDTTYGFNSNAGRDAFDFVLTPAPMMAIWDAGGIDTLDASGYGTNQVIDLNPGALSSIGGITADEFPTFAQVNINRAAAGMAPVSQATYDTNRNLFMTNPALYGRLTDNVGIAYGATIENAVGGRGNDTILGNNVDNVLTGNAGNDLILGGLGNDTLDGGVGNDEMLGGVGDDALNGGAGDDLLMGGAGADRLDGGEGFDTASYRDSAVGVTVNVTNKGVTVTGDGVGDFYLNIEAYEGSNFADAFNGGNLDDVLSGLGGNDTLIGANGADTLNGGDGDDLLDGGNDADTLNGGAGADTLKGGFGDDLLNGGDGNDDLDGSNGIDTLNGGAGDDVLNGGLGNDVLNGGAGSDRLTGGSGNDIFRFTDAGGTDTVTDFRRGQDKIDLSGFFGADAADVRIEKSNIFVDFDNDGIVDLTIVTTGVTITQADILFG